MRAAEGYGEIVDREMEADHFNGEHAHEFDAYVLVVDGEMTISRAGEPQLFRAGDMCTMPAGTVHTASRNAARRARVSGRPAPPGALI